MLGRVLIALIFLRSGAAKIVGFTGTAATMAGKGMPYPEYLLVAAIAIELIGGIALVFGYKVRAAAAALIVFLVPATLIFHNYWAADAAQVVNQTSHFFKNVALLGALVFLLGVGAGGGSIDNRARY
ncbi:MAG TPA: DoxX family protein [Burkholderiales bacterium]|nr:DoxX family protein [Burkholderiales bacterium]